MNIDQWNDFKRMMKMTVADYIYWETVDPMQFVSSEGDTVTVATHSQWMTIRLKNLLSRNLSYVLGKAIEVKFEMRPRPEMLAEVARKRAYEIAETAQRHERLRQHILASGATSPSTPPRARRAAPWKDQ